MFVVDDQVVTKQKHLRATACETKEAVTQKAEEMAALAAYAAHLWKQLDFLDCHEKIILQLELEYLKLLEHSRVQVLESSASSPGSFSSFSDMMEVLDWLSLGITNSSS